MTAAIPDINWDMFFTKGEQMEKLPFEELLPALLRRIDNL